VTTGYRLVELNAKNGAMIASFGEQGMVDVKVGAVTGLNNQIDLETGEIGCTQRRPCEDVVLVGSSFKEGTQPITHNNTKGMVSAFDVRTGKKLWQFNTIPKPGEFGYDTWLNDSAEINGNTGVWTQITADEELGWCTWPSEDPTSDQYGGHRPGNNLFADSLVCVDLKTGKRKWHYQWFITRCGTTICLGADSGRHQRQRARGQGCGASSKESFLYVFDRVTGEPVWPIEERPAPKGDVPGEWYSPTQPFRPSRRLTHARRLPSTS